MGTTHYNGQPATSDAALFTASATTPVAHITAVNQTPLPASVTLSVRRSISGVAEVVAAAQAVPALSAAELVDRPRLAMGEVILDPGDSLHGSASGTAPAAPTVANAATGGTVAAGAYGVKVTYVSATGETIASAAASTTTSGSTSTLTVTSPAANAAATGWYAYVTQADGSTYKRQQTAGSPTAVGTDLTLTGPPTSTGVQPPTVAGITVVAFE